MLIVYWVAIMCLLPQSAFAFDIFGTTEAIPSTPSAEILTGNAGATCQFGPLATPLRLEDAVDRALCDNPKTRESWANVKVQAAGVGVAKAAYLPSVSANWQDVRDDSVTDVTGYPALGSADRSTIQNGSVSLNWVLYDFGGRKAALSNAQELLAAARANQDATLQSTFSSVATDYYAAQAAVGKLANAQETERIAHDSFIAASARVHNGVAAITDQLQAQTSYAQATYNRAKTEGDLQTALGTLASDMSLSPGQPIIVPQVAEGVSPDHDFAESVEELIDEAERTHPSVAAARAQLDAAISKEQQTRAEGLPSISFVAKYSRNNQPASLGLGEPQFPATGHDWYFGVQVQIPLFEGFGRTYQVRQAQAQIEVQRDTLDEARQQVGLDVWKTYQLLQTDTENLQNTAALLQIARQSFEAAKHRYVAGVGNILELLNAQSALSDANRQRIQALTDWRAARLQLAAKMGRLDVSDLRRVDSFRVEKKRCRTAFEREGTNLKILFIHQNLPGQFRHLIFHFAQDPEAEVVAIGEKKRILANFRGAVAGVRFYGYEFTPTPREHAHRDLWTAENAIRRGRAVAACLKKLRGEGFRPDAVYGHPGWGEMLHVRDVFPNAHIVNYCEFYFNREGQDYGFDPEFPDSDPDGFRIRTENMTQLASLVSADAGISPTCWQKSRYPDVLRERISVIHDGIDVGTIKPDPAARVRLPSKSLTLTAADQVITYVSRNLEPYRGFHIFMRALPELQRRLPHAHFLIVGGDEVSYGRPAVGCTYKEKYLGEVGAQLDMSRIHFLGRIRYLDYLRVLQISTAHIYLTYPFVLSWSMLEAMAAGTVLIGSRTAPVQEVIRDGRNGLLVDFFSQTELVEATCRVCADPSIRHDLRLAGMATVSDNFNLRRNCLPRQVTLLRGHQVCTPSLDVEMIASPP